MLQALRARSARGFLDFLHPLDCRFSHACCRRFSSLDALSCKSVCIVVQICPEVCSETFTLTFLFPPYFFQLPVCLLQLGAGTVPCALIRHLLAEQSVLLLAQCFTIFTDCFSLKDSLFSALHPGADTCSIRALAFISKFHSPCVAPCLLLQPVPSLRSPSLFTSEVFFWCHR